jgi:hypothetical protein
MESPQLPQMESNWGFHRDRAVVYIKIRAQFIGPEAALDDILLDPLLGYPMYGHIGR